MSPRATSNAVGTDTPFPEGRPHLVIRPSRGLANLGLHEVWSFRDLLVILGMRDVRLVYKQTLLGVTWVVLQPLIGAGIFAFVFGMLADMPSGGLPYFLFAFTGMSVWTLFSTTLTAGATSLVTNGHLVSKIYFPRLILPLTSAFQPLVNFGVTLIPLALALATYGVWPTWRVLFAPVWLALLLMLALGASFCLSAVMVHYRDVRFIVPVMVQFLLYASPVGYALSALDGQSLPVWAKAGYMLNPLASLLEAFRWSVLGVGQLSPGWLGYAGTVSLAGFVVGAYLFRRAERRFADVI